MSESLDRTRVKNPNNLSDAEVLGIFTMKAKGMQDRDISKKTGVSLSTISRILRRVRYEHVQIPQQIETIVAQTRRAPGRSRKKAAEKHPSIDRSVALAKFTNACYEIADAELACIDAGIDKEVLSHILHLATKERHL